jgi:hypothetical protein
MSDLSCRIYLESPLTVTIKLNTIGSTNTLPNSSAVSDFLIGDGSLGWNVKTLAETQIILGIISTDEKVKYDAADPSAGYLADKIIAGTGITIAEGSGADENKLKISGATNYTLPVATDVILGGVKKGSRVSIDANGVISADVQTTDISGKVNGPANNTADYIPQWNGTDSKTLKDGLAVPAGGLAGLTALGGKQDTLQSGTNIKTIGGTSVLGSGDIPVTSQSLAIAFAVAL